MAPVVDHQQSKREELPQGLLATRELADVPGLMADRIGQLYAEEERISRTERTERLIQQASRPE